MPITRIISGGQAGADRGGLEAALYCNVPHGGWCPKGRKAEDGIIPPEYQLQETKSADYLQRTHANVRDSDATLVFTLGTPSRGSLRTIEFARELRRPWHNIDVALEDRPRAVSQIVAWLAGDIAWDYGEYQAHPPQKCTLNIAGSRESKADGIQLLVTAIMVDVLRTVNPECHHFYPMAG